MLNVSQMWTVGNLKHCSWEWKLANCLENKFGPILS